MKPRCRGLMETWRPAFFVSFVPFCSRSLSQRRGSETRVCDHKLPGPSHTLPGPSHTLPGPSHTLPGTPLAAFVVGAILAVLPAPALAAFEVSLVLDRALAWVGETVVARVRITDPPRGVQFSGFPAVDGLRIDGAGQGRETNISNGRMVNTVTLNFRVTPLRASAGKFVLGPAVLKRQNGTEVKTNTVELNFFKRRETPLEFSCRVEPAEGNIGKPFRVFYEFVYSQDLDSINNLDLPIFDLPDGWVRPVSKLRGFASQPLRTANGSTLHLLNGIKEYGDGYGAYRSVFAFDITPYSTGQVPLGDAVLAVELRTGRRVKVRGFLVDETKKDTRRSPSLAYRVLPLPRENRPAVFSGAVGRFQIQTKASATSVDAGAPITLEITISGEGYFDRVPPPPLARIESLRKGFQIDTTVDDGEILDNSKVFRQLIRPLNATVKEIPAIPYAYYDPASGKYQTTYSDPIAIDVRDVATVGSDDIIASSRAGAVENRAEALQPAAILTQSGIPANRRQLGSVRAVLDPRQQLTRAPFLAALLLPPVLLALLAVVVRRGKRDPRQKRAEQALGRARSRFPAAAGCEEISSVFQDYFRERLSLGDGELTPVDLRRHLADRGVAEDLTERACSLPRPPARWPVRRQRRGPRSARRRSRCARQGGRFMPLTERERELAPTWLLRPRHLAGAAAGPHVDLFSDPPRRCSAGLGIWGFGIWGFGGDGVVRRGAGTVRRGKPVRAGTPNPTQ